MRGRKPKPNAIKQIEGNAGRRPLAQTLELPPGIPECPLELGSLARQEWMRVVPILTAAKILTEADRAALAAYCSSWARFIETEQIIEREGLAACITSKNLAITLSIETIQGRAQKRMKEWAEQLGLTPVARARLKIENPEQPDLFEKFDRGEGEFSTQSSIQ